MSFVADESVDIPIIIALRNAGYNVLSISEEQAGIDDEVVLKIAKEKNSVLITSDKDFGELVFRLKLVSSGIILLRLPELENQEKSILTLQCIENFKDKLPVSFCVITSNKIRIVAL